MPALEMLKLSSFDLYAVWCSNKKITTTTTYYYFLKVLYK